MTESGKEIAEWVVFGVVPPADSAGTGVIAPGVERGVTGGGSGLVIGGGTDVSTAGVRGKQGKPKAPAEGSDKFRVGAET